MSRLTDRDKIAALNDDFRQTTIGGRIVATRGVAMLPGALRARILDAVRRFDAFDEGNDPYGEHDFGAVTVDGVKVFWKIDYYDLALAFGSEHPEDPDQTVRVLTVMLPEER
jgi:Protein of unknown function (DUF3768)